MELEDRDTTKVEAESIVEVEDEDQDEEEAEGATQTDADGVEAMVEATLDDGDSTEDVRREDSWKAM